MIELPSLPWWRRFTFQIVALVLVFTVLPQIVLRTYNLQIIRDETLRTIQRNNLAQAENAAEQLTSQINSQTDLLQLLADSPPLRAGNWELARHELERLQVQHPEIATLIIIDTAGKEQLQISTQYVEPPCVWDDAPCFQTVMNDEIYQGGLQFVSGLGQRLLVAVPIFDHARQEVIGVLAGQLSLRPLLEQLNTTQIGDNGYVYLVDEGGRIIAHPDASLVLAQVDGRSIPEVNDLLEGRLEREEVAPSEYDSLGGERVFGVHAPVEGLRWGIVAEQPIDEAFALVQSESDLRTAMLVSGLLLSVILAVGLGYFLARPVSQLTHAAQQLASGERPTRTASSREDEIGRLTSVFNQMVDNTQSTEESLRESEKKYRQLVELAQEGIWVIDKDANTTFVNPSMAGMLGYTEDEMIGKHLFSFMDERGIEISTHNLERREQGITEQHDFEFIRKDGARIYTTMETAPINDEAGKYAGAIAGVIDITERRLVKDSLIETNQLLTSIFDNTHVLVAYLDAEFNFVKVNQAYAQADERDTAFFEGKNHFDLYPNAENEAIFRRVLATGEAHAELAKSFEYEANLERGASYWDWHLIPIEGVDGQIKGLILTLLDVTERIQAKESLAKERFQLKAIIDSIPVMITRYDPTANMLYLNNDSIVVI